MTPKLNLVVAMCSNRGIGIDGKLPWRLRGDMAFFKKITSATVDKALQNAVIMGRKTWESIPQKFRPLSGRINIVISTSLNRSHLPSDVYLARSFDGAIKLVQSESLQDQLEQVFIIGGSSVYNSALSSPLCHRIFLTRVLNNIKCDTYMPEIDQDVYQLTKYPGVEDDIQKEDELEYKYEVYEKTKSV